MSQDGRVQNACAYLAKAGDIKPLACREDIVETPLDWLVALARWIHQRVVALVRFEHNVVHMHICRCGWWEATCRRGIRCPRGALALRHRRKQIVAGRSLRPGARITGR